MSAPDTTLLPIAAPGAGGLWLYHDREKQKRAAQGATDALALAAPAASLAPRRPTETKPAARAERIKLASRSYDPLFAEYRDLDDVPGHFLREVEHFFATYKQLEGIHIEPQGWDNAQAATSEVRESVERYVAVKVLPEHWEAEGQKRDYKEVILEAAKEVGPPSFFALLVIAVSFLPIFTLEAQEGRLFRPVAFSKSFSINGQRPPTGI